MTPDQLPPEDRLNHTTSELSEAISPNDELSAPVSHEVQSAIADVDDGKRDARSLDVYRSSDSPLVADLIDNVFQQLLATQAAQHANANMLRKHLWIVLLDLYVAHGESPSGYVRYSRNKNDYRAQSRYNRIGVTYAPLIHAVRGLAQLGYVEEYPPTFNLETKKGQQTRLRATPQLIELIEQSHGVTPSMIGRSDGYMELIQLKDDTPEKKFMEYKDTDQTRDMRAFVGRYNAFIQSQDIRLSADGELGASSLGHPVDYTRNSSYRVFNNGSIELGGRFYGTWWVGVPSALRSTIMINGNPTVELDYSAMHLHLLYGLEGLSYHELFGADDDPYSLPDYEHIPRAAIKIVFLVALNANTPTRAYKGVWSKLRKSRLSKALGDTSPRELIAALAGRHSKIAHHLLSGIGLKNMNLDSQIAEYVLGTLMDQGIPALGIHDSFIVEQSQCENLRTIMNEAPERFGLSSIPAVT